MPSVRGLDDASQHCRLLGLPHNDAGGMIPAPSHSLRTLSQLQTIIQTVSTPPFPLVSTARGRNMKDSQCIRISADRRTSPRGGPEIGVPGHGAHLVHLTARGPGKTHLHPPQPPIAFLPRRTPCPGRWAAASSSHQVPPRCTTTPACTRLRAVFPPVAYLAWSCRGLGRHEQGFGFELPQPIERRKKEGLLGTSVSEMDCTLFAWEERKREASPASKSRRTPLSSAAHRSFPSPRRPPIIDDGKEPSRDVPSPPNNLGTADGRRCH